MILISIIITLLYLLLIGSFVYGFDKVKHFNLEHIPAKTRFSVIIPFRNEATNLPDLLKSIESLEYPKHLFEVILVDDESNDGSADLVMRFLRKSRTDIKVINNERVSNSPKKDAITTAIKLAKSDWIVTTDADCILPKYWLDSFDEYVQKTSAKCIVAPVTYNNIDTFLNRFQLLDVLSLQGATIGGFGINKPFLCNGANFAYQKSLFFELNGFKGNNTIASGDDIFLLEKVVSSYPKALHYLKYEQAIVATKSQATWKDLISQRIRWAAKTSAYNNWFGKLTGLIVLVMNGFLITLPLLATLGIIDLKIVLYIGIIKLNVDFLLIYKTATFFDQKGVLKSYLIAFFVYPFFSVYVAFISMFSNYKWKGRDFKK
jgi:cellulose synthase/poly-beta-1,6-N-acetylglucosamine synthase-like glycosyltransferase